MEGPTKMSGSVWLPLDETKRQTQRRHHLTMHRLAIAEGALGNIVVPIHQRESHSSVVPKAGSHWSNKNPP